MKKRKLRNYLIVGSTCPDDKDDKAKLFSGLADDTKTSNSHRLWIWCIHNWTIRKYYSLVWVIEDFKSQLDQALAELV